MRRREKRVKQEPVEKPVAYGKGPGSGPGRPTYWRPEMIDMIDSIEDGTGSLVEMAELLDVAYSTVNVWMKTRPDFRRAVMNLRKRVDEEVENAVLKKAKGYSIPNITTKTEEVMVDAGDITGIDMDEGEEAFKVPGRKVTTTEGHTHIPPDITAAKFWLTNRNPERWSEKQKLEVTSDMPWGVLLERVDAAMVDLKPDEYHELTEDEGDEDA